MRHAFIAAATATLLAGCAATPPAADGMGMAPALTTAPLAATTPSDLPRTARPLHYRIAITPDMEGLTFSGRASVDMEVFERTQSIVLHANDLDISEATLTMPDGSRVPLTVRMNAGDQTVQLRSPRALQPGAYSVETVYSGTINTQAYGLFALDYPDKVTGEEKRALFTQFEAPDARRFAPMFDEPSYKATFDLVARVPSDLMAVGNMPVAGEIDLGDGMKEVTFATSPKMSSYLLFFSLGDFERDAKLASDGTEVGIVAPTGSGAQTRYALDGLAPLMGYFNDYFGVDYPLPKLDNVTAPGQSQFFGAMENWGAILTFEPILLDNPAITSPAARQRIFSVQAHETAHQWFGNIVTMAWWEDLWLNEGFASWMATKATDNFHPEWYPLLGRVAGRENAMGLDSLASTHPVIQPIETVAETAQAFDAIAYRKGEAVITMLENYAGDDVWRRGLQIYMDRHKYSNTVSADLWRAVEEAGATGLTAIADDFTRQPGIPLVAAEASCANGRTSLRLEQGQFSRDRRDAVATDPLSWQVPLTIRAANGSTQRQVLRGPATYDLPGCGAVIVNGGQTGYFRTLYTPAMADQLVAGMGEFQPIDQLGLLADNLALSNAGYQPMGEALDMLAAVPANAIPVVAQAAIGAWTDIYSTLEDEGAKARIAAMATDRWAPRLRSLGFEPRANEQVVDANLRSALLVSLGAMGDEGVATQARTRFARLSDDPRALDGPLRTAWLDLAGANASEAEWELVRRLAGEATSSVEKSTYYSLLGSVEDEALARRALDLALTGEAGTASAAIIRSVAENHPEMAFDFVLANQEQVRELVDASGWQGYLASLAGGSSDAGMLTRLETLRSGLAADEAVPVTRAIDSLRQRQQGLPRQRAGIMEWLAAR